ncbi:MAG: DUF4062 domain-containing protein, partial [Deltaproteobacteria bacterium]|nr:DUF4062 domain-containing protein [Deltaproteobacteria bacterium]
PRVFVSSVMENFQPYRNAARQGIIAAGGEPVLVEDFPSLPVAPRTACLEAVASCDIYLVIIGDHGGFPTPYGKLVVEEEYAEALRCKLRLLAFIEAVDRDQDAERLVSRVSNYVSGLFRTTFLSSDQLRSLVENALNPIIKDWTTLEVNMTAIDEKMKDTIGIGSEAVLRVVFVPERKGQLVDPVDLESPVLYTSIMEIGHSPAVGLFAYEHGKKKEIGIDEIVITQGDSHQHREPINFVRLELASNGILIIDTNITGRVQRGNEYDLLNSMVIAEEDVREEMKKVFAFALALLEKLDRYCRFDRMLYNAALSNIGHRNLETNPRPRQSYQMGMGGDKIVSAFDQPRLITRADLRTPDRELEAIITMFRRRMKESS